MHNDDLAEMPGRREHKIIDKGKGKINLDLLDRSVASILTFYKAGFCAWPVQKNQF